MARNQYKDNCIRCGRPVEPGMGFFEKLSPVDQARFKKRWTTRCQGCVNGGHIRCYAAATLEITWKSCRGNPRRCEMLFEKENEGSDWIMRAVAEEPGPIAPRSIYNASDKRVGLIPHALAGDKRLSWRWTWRTPGRG